MSKIKNENFVLIQGWMINELNLKGNDLLVYAIIYNFSQAENQRFTGSLQYLADWTNSTKQGVIKNLKYLLDRGLIAREEKSNGVLNSVEYYTTQFNGGIKLSLPNNKYNNIIEEKDISKDISKKKSEDNFIKPTLEEVTEYCKERNNNIDPQSFIAFYEAKGWLIGRNKMKNWKAAIVTWERNNLKKTQTKKKSINEQCEDILRELEERENRKDE